MTHVIAIEAIFGVAVNAILAVATVVIAKTVARIRREVLRHPAVAEVGTLGDRARVLAHGCGHVRDLVRNVEAIDVKEVSFGAQMNVADVVHLKDVHPKFRGTQGITSQWKRETEFALGASFMICWLSQ